MWFTSLFSRGQAHSSRARPARRKPPSPRLCVEALEDRIVPSFLAPVSYPVAANGVQGLRLTGRPHSSGEVDFVKDHPLPFSSAIARHGGE